MSFATFIALSAVLALISVAIVAYKASRNNETW